MNTPIDDYFKKTIGFVDPEPGSLAIGMVWGLKPSLERGTEIAIKTVGMLHVISASGANVALLLDILRVGVQYLAKPIRLVCCALAIVTYGWLLDWPISLLRAVVVALIQVVAQSQQSQASVKRSFWFAFLMCWGFEEFKTPSLGMQLSFGASGALIWIYPKILTKIDHFLPKIGIETRSKAIQKQGSSWVKLLLLEPLCTSLAISLVLVPRLWWVDDHWFVLAPIVWVSLWWYLPIITYTLLLLQGITLVSGITSGLWQFPIWVSQLLEWLVNGFIEKTIAWSSLESWYWTRPQNYKVVSAFWLSSLLLYLWVESSRTQRSRFNKGTWWWKASV